MFKTKTNFEKLWLPITSKLDTKQFKLNKKKKKRKYKLIYWVFTIFRYLNFIYFFLLVMF